MLAVVALPLQSALAMTMRQLVLGLILLNAGCARTPSPADALTVYAAASTRETLEELAQRFRARDSSEILLNFGSSSALARQIEQGAHANLFITADPAWSTYLAEKGLARERRELCTNRLVVVVPQDSPITLRSLGDLNSPQVGRLALAGPSVPAGVYAREALQHAQLLDAVRNRIVEGADVRAALTYVARGEADAGIVYASDAAVMAGMRVALEIDPLAHSPIRYEVVLIRTDGASARAVAFVDFLLGDEGRAILRKHGLQPPAP